MLRDIANPLSTMNPPVPLASPCQDSGHQVGSWFLWEDMAMVAGKAIETCYKGYSDWTFVVTTFDGNNYVRDEHRFYSCPGDLETGDGLLKDPGYIRAFHEARAARFEHGEKG